MFKGLLTRTFYSKDIESWPELSYPREPRDDNAEIPTYGDRFYRVFWAVLVCIIWFPFTLQAGLFVARGDYKSLSVELSVVIALRIAFCVVEYRTVKDFIDRQAHEQWVMQFRKSTVSNSIPSKKVKFRASWQFGVRAVALFSIAGIVLVVLGSSRPSQKWAIWMGLAILIELGLRLTIEQVWRNTRHGEILKIWLKKKDWW